MKEEVKDHSEKDYCGHYHTDKKMDKLELVFESSDVFCGVIVNLIKRRKIKFINYYRSLIQGYNVYDIFGVIGIFLGGTQWTM